MCQHCDYSGLLEGSDLGYTPNRHRVLEVVGNNSSPLSAQQIFDTLSRTDNINRVTVYRILDLLVVRGLVDRISGGGTGSLVQRLHFPLYLLPACLLRPPDLVLALQLLSDP